MDITYMEQGTGIINRKRIKKSQSKKLINQTKDGLWIKTQAKNKDMRNETKKKKKKIDISKDTRKVNSQ